MTKYAQMAIAGCLLRLLEERLIDPLEFLEIADALLYVMPKDGIFNEKILEVVREMHEYTKQLKEQKH